MKLIERRNRVQLTGDAEEYAFEMVATPKIFRMLADNYRYKDEAIIRELSCNGWDAQGDADNLDVPMEVHLPTSSQPYFSIRDFGIGLEKDFLIKTYITFGDSTRTNSNNHIGALGIGSKSPFGYTDSFVVESWKDGEHTICLMYENDLGYYRARVMVHEFDIDKPNGVKITVNVEPDDVRSWQQAAERVYPHFPVQPKFSGYKPDIKLPEYVMEGDGWGLCVGHDDYWRRRTASAIMGNISYPLEYADEKIPQEVHDLMRVKMDVNFNIGDLSIDNSREGLSYDKRTVNNIIYRFKQIISELEAKCSEYFESCDCLWDAAVAHHNITDVIPASIVNNLPTECFKWQGKEVYTIIDGYVEGVKLYKFTKTSAGNARRSESNNIHVHGSFHFVEDDLKVGGQARCREYVKNSTDDKICVVLVKFRDNAVRTEWMERLGILERHMVKASSLPKPTPKPRNSGGSTLNKVEEVSLFVGGRLVSYAWENKQKDLKEGGLYVELKRFQPIHPTKDDYHCYDLESLKNDVQRVLGKDIEVWGIKSQLIEQVESDSNWQNFFDYVKELCEEVSKDSETVDLLWRQESIEEFEDGDFHLTLDSISELMDFAEEGTVLHSLKLDYEKTVLTTEQQEKIRNINRLRSALGEEKLVVCGPYTNLVDRWKQIEEKVPLIKALPWSTDFNDESGYSFANYIHYCLEN